MAVYMVERELPGITPEQLAHAQEAAISTSRQFTQEGKPVRYIRSTFLPDDSRCLCLFEAPTRQLVRDVNDAAGLPVSRIVQALDLSPVLALVVLVLSMLSAACGTNPLAPVDPAAPRHARAEAVVLQPDSKIAGADGAPVDFPDADRRFVFTRRACNCYDVDRWHH